MTRGCDTAEDKYSDFITTGSGLRYKDLKVGDGAIPLIGDTVQVNYTGWLEDFDSVKKFDSSYDRRSPLVFKVGVLEVIPGWDEGLLTNLKVGGKRNLVIPPILGYGSMGAGDLIPSNATLYFTVELVGILGSATTADGSSIVIDPRDVTIGHILNTGSLYNTEVASLAINLSILDASSILAITNTLVGKQKFNPQNFTAVSDVCSKGNFNIAILVNGDLRVHFSPTSGPLILVYKKAGEMPELSPLKTDIKPDPLELDSLQSLYEQGGFRDMIAQATNPVSKLVNNINNSFYTCPKPYLGIPLPKLDVLGTFKFSKSKEYILVTTKIPVENGFMQIIAYK